MAKSAFQAMKIFGQQGVERNALLVVEDGRFLGFYHKQDVERMGIPIRDYKDYMILPGLVDTHIHGAVGRDTMDATPDSLEKIGKFLLSRGTTAWMPTTVTSEIEAICRAVRNVQACRDMQGAARILGCFVEGPYITKEHKGAHPENLIRPLDRAEVEKIAAAGEISVLAVAPEKENALEFITWAARRGIRVSLAHSSADYAASRAAIKAGADAVAHAFCGMSGLHHRKPNLIGAALTVDDVYAELIADGIHVEAPAMEILLRCKPKDKVILVSDAIQATGLPDGEYMLGVLPIAVKGGISRVANGSLAGSTATLLEEVRRLVLELKTDALAAVHMASLNPSRRLGLSDEIGSIVKGKKADFIIVDKAYGLKETWLGGEKVFG